MKKCLVLGCLLGIMSLAVAADPAPNAPSVDVVGLKIATPLKDPKLDVNWDVGLTIRMRMNSKEGVIVRPDLDASRVTSLKDDKGTDLLIAKPPPSRDIPFYTDVPGFYPSLDYSDDHKICVFEFRAVIPPTKGATSISLKGEMSVIIASGSQSVTVENVEAKVGTKFAVGAASLEIVGIAKARFNDGMTINLRSDQNAGSIAEMSFFRADGSRLDVRSISTSMDGLSRTYGFSATTLPEKIKVIAKVWKDMQTIKMPLDLNASLGL